VIGKRHIFFAPTLSKQPTPNLEVSMRILQILIEILIDTTDYDSYPDGANVAMASSSSFDDRNSRTSSIVRNNGRLRGFVSETRNGRTKVRKIGDDGAESDDEY